MTRRPIVTEALEAVIAAPPPWDALAGRDRVMKSDGRATRAFRYPAHRLTALSPEKGLRVAPQPAPAPGHMQSKISRGLKPRAIIAGGFRRTVLSFSDL